MTTGAQQHRRQQKASCTQTYAKKNNGKKPPLQENPRSAECMKSLIVYSIGSSSDSSSKYCTLTDSFASRRSTILQRCHPERTSLPVEVVSLSAVFTRHKESTTIFAIFWSRADTLAFLFFFVCTLFLPTDPLCLRFLDFRGIVALKKNFFFWKPNGFWPTGYRVSGEYYEAVQHSCI